MGKKTKGTGEPDLKGTFISVLAVGVIIAAMWFVVYGMYVSR